MKNEPGVMSGPRTENFGDLENDSPASFCCHIISESLT